jgi:hypothetical protein
VAVDGMGIADDALAWPNDVEEAEEVEMSE